MKRDAIVWVKDEDFLKEIDCLRRRARVFGGQIGSTTLRELLQVLECFQVGDETLVRLGWRANDLENDSQLIIRREGETFALLSRVLGW